MADNRHKDEIINLLKTLYVISLWIPHRAVLLYEVVVVVNFLPLKCLPAYTKVDWHLDSLVHS
jgi:hypothetical protein